MHALPSFERTGVESRLLGKGEVMKYQLTAATSALLLVLGTVAAMQDARAANDPGVRGGTPGAGDPVANLTQDQGTLFSSGHDAFAEVEQLGDGLGPRFNLDSCGGCHSQPAEGGTAPALNPQVTVATAFGAHNKVPGFITANGPIREARFKFGPTGARDGGVHSLFVISGRVDTSGNAGGCAITQDDFDGQFSRGNVSLRIPTPTFGAGLLENIPDANLIANLGANASRKAALGVAGHLNHNGNDGTITRFGWKAQNVSLLIFAGEAYNVEMGLTNENFPTEREQNANCQPDPTPNNITGSNGIAAGTVTLSDIEKFALFMRFLGPPTASATAPGGSASIARGTQQFQNVGCALCHTPSLMTGNTSVAALANQKVALFSDLAVHHMGPRLADNIVQGQAGGDEFRTAPLWGLGQRIFFLHDGRTTDLVQAIEAHASGGFGGFVAATNGFGSSFGPSEANEVIENFNALSDASQQDLLNFLRSL
jgi:CxxC motif-containing protein (DUF1111 family)